jgi:predicted RNA-binding protein Jag
MLDLQEINNTITMLENSDTTFVNCDKLASLYIVKEHLENATTSLYSDGSSIVKEYDDILPQYRLYCEVKKKYQQHELTEQAVDLAMKDVCKEIQEFIHTLYSSTDMQSERDAIKQMIQELGVL